MLFTKKSDGTMVKIDLSKLSTTELNKLPPTGEILKEQLKRGLGATPTTEARLTAIEEYLGFK